MQKLPISDYFSLAKTLLKCAKDSELKSAIQDQFLKSPKSLKDNDPKQGDLKKFVDELNKWAPNYISVMQTIQEFDM